MTDESRLDELLEMACRDAPEWTSNIMKAAAGKMCVLLPLKSSRQHLLTKLPPRARQAA